MNLAEYYIQKRIREGDIHEYEKLFMKYYEPLCHHAVKFLHDMDLAEDIVQEFFYHFWKNRETLRLRLSLEAYLFTSVRNNSLHYLEHLKVRQHYHNMKASEPNAGILNEELPGIGLKELRKVIEMTLERLPERCSMIFRMNRYDGMKYREIAEALTISVKTVEADMGKALQQFRESLKDYKQVELH
jgi:RNA polymerase sigma-70 factor (ECF subfamily)